MCLKSGAIGNIQTGWSVPDAACLRVEVWGDRGRLLLEDPTFGDGISARLYAAQTGHGEFGRPIGKFLDIPPELYKVPGTQFTGFTDRVPKWVPRETVQGLRGQGSPKEFHGHSSRGFTDRVPPRSSRDTVHAVHERSSQDAVLPKCFRGTL